MVCVYIYTREVHFCCNSLLNLLSQEFLIGRSLFIRTFDLAIHVIFFLVNPRRNQCFMFDHVISIAPGEFSSGGGCRILEEDNNFKEQTINCDL